MINIFLYIFIYVEIDKMKRFSMNKRKKKNLLKMKTIKTIKHKKNQKKNIVKKRWRRKNPKSLLFTFIDDFHEFKRKGNNCIIVPYRNRYEHLQLFLQYFSKKGYDIYIIEQNNDLKFNRGMLLNIGFDIASKRKKYDYYIFHDVDSIPDKLLIPYYRYRGDKIIHYASPYLGYKYKNPSFFGGVSGMTDKDYRKINGFPNRVFGWGKEDNMLRERVRLLNKKIYRPREGSYQLLDHTGPTHQTINLEDENFLMNRDKKEWKMDGLTQVSTMYRIEKEIQIKYPHIRFFKIDFLPLLS